MTRRVPSPVDPEPIRGDVPAIGRDLARRSREAGFSAIVIQPDGGVWRVTLTSTAVRIGDLPQPTADATPPYPPPVQTSGGGIDA